MRKTNEEVSAFLVKIGNEDNPPVFSTIAGLRTTERVINGNPVDHDNEPVGGRRGLPLAGGIISVSISGIGFFAGPAAEVRLKAQALSGTSDDFELSFESGETMRGRFMITRLDYAGDCNDERAYVLTLKSTGTPISMG